MAHFIVTFRVHEDAGYQKRYDSLVERVKKIAAEAPWEETTSFFAFQANGTARSVCDDIYYNSSVIEPKDQLLVIDLDRRQHAHFGIKYPNTLAASLGTLLV